MEEYQHEERNLRNFFDLGFLFVLDLFDLRLFVLGFLLFWMIFRLRILGSFDILFDG